MDRTLYRSRGDRMVAGVAGGLADYFGIDPTVVRIAIVLLALVTNGGVLIAYLIMAIVVPEEPIGGAAAQPPAQPPVQPPAQPPAQPYARPYGTSTDVPEVMGPGEVPEPGEFGRPAVPDPSEGVAPPPPPAAPMPPASRRGDGRGAGVVGAVLVVLGLILLFERFIDIDLVRLWPLILIAIGISIMFRRKG